MHSDEYFESRQLTTSLKNGFLFLKLPGKIQNLIYPKALHKDGIVKSLKQQALLCTIKQIQDEALPIYCAENRFFVSACATYDQIPRSI